MLIYVFMYIYIYIIFKLEDPIKYQGYLSNVGLV